MGEDTEAQRGYSQDYPALSGRVLDLNSGNLSLEFLSLTRTPPVLVQRDLRYKKVHRTKRSGKERLARS